MNKIKGLIVIKGLILLGFIAGICASRLMGSRGNGVKEKVIGKAEQLKGRVEQAAGKAREKIVEIKGNARAAIDEATA